MRTRTSSALKLGATALATAALALAGSSALAAEYWLRAAPTTVPVPNPAGPPAMIDVPMWGYAKCNIDGINGFNACDPVTVPGPALTVPAGEGLTVHLRNDLARPTSLVITGQPLNTLSSALAATRPVWDGGATGPRTLVTQRVRSFTNETPVGAEVDYSWPAIQPGTYLYQSGTQPQVQVQMGLYGAMSKNAADAVPGTTPTPAQAYASVAYDNQATLLYSEVDPLLHKVINLGGYGADCSTPNWAGTDPPSTCVTSAIDYAPRYFLINGKVYPDLSLIFSPLGNPGTTLLRLLNAGLTTQVPMINGAQWTVVAEDGKPYPYRRSQYTALLPAAKTMDVLFMPDIGGATYSIMDRRLGLSNAGQSNGGMLVKVQYGALGSAGGSAANSAPIALSDSYSSIAGVTLNVGAPEGVLNQLHDVGGTMTPDYDPDHLPLPIKVVAAGGPTDHGTYTLNTNGSFSYTPTPGYVGDDTFAYQVTDGDKLSSAATVTITLSSPAAPTLSTIDNFDRADSAGLNDGSTHIWRQVAGTVTTVPDLQIVNNEATAVTTDLGGLAIWNPNLGATQYAGFSSTSGLKNSALVLKATGTDPAAPVNYVRVRCEGEEVVVATMMGGSGASIFAKQAAFPAAGCATSNGPLSAVVDAKGLVTVFLAGVYTGGVQLADVPAWKGAGRIGIQLQTVGATVNDFSGGEIVAP